MVEKYIQCTSEKAYTGLTHENVVSKKASTIYKYLKKNSSIVDKSSFYAVQKFVFQNIHS